MKFPIKRSAMADPCKRVGQFSVLATAACFSSGLLLAVCVSADEQKVISSHGLSTFGELKYPPGFAQFDYVWPDAPKGGEMSTWGFGNFDNFNPYIVAGTAEFYSTILFESLMVRSHDEPDAVYGLLAESVEYSDDRHWAVFNIRPEARFSDGSPVTAKDVVFSYRTLTEQGLPRFRIDYADFESVEAIAPLEVKFTFREPADTNKQLLAAAEMPIFAEAGLQEEQDFATPSASPLLTSAPYQVEMADIGSRVVYERWKDYWGNDLAVNRGRHNFDRISIDYYTDYTAAFEGFKGGSYDFREEFLSTLWATGYDFPEIAAGDMIVETIPDGRPTGTQGYWFNLRKEKFQDIRTRRAIALAFNFEWSNATLFHGLYQRTDSFWENSPLQASGLPNEGERQLIEPLAELLPDSLLSMPAFVPPVSGEALADRELLQEAARLLDQAGWRLVDGKRRNSDGAPLQIAFLSDSPSFDRITQPFIENLGRLGIDARIDRVDFAQAQRRLDEFEFDLATRRYVMDATPGPGIRSIFGSVAAGRKGSENIAGIANPAIDALIDQVVMARDRDSLQTAVRALDRSLRTLHIWVPQWFSSEHRVAYRNRFGRPDPVPPYELGKFDLWWAIPDTEG